MPPPGGSTASQARGNSSDFLAELPEARGTPVRRDVRQSYGTGGSGKSDCQRRRPIAVVAFNHELDIRILDLRGNDVDEFGRRRNDGTVSSCSSIPVDTLKERLAAGFRFAIQLDPQCRGGDLSLDTIDSARQ